MTPVFVCVSASSPILTDGGGVIPTEFHVGEPIGYLGGFDVDIKDIDMARRDLAPLKVKYLARGVKANDGCIGALCALAVEVSTYEEAIKLPGFVLLGDWGGAFYPPPHEEFNPVLKYPDDDVDGVPIKRCDVRDAYGYFEPPKYDNTGVFIQSRIPMGIIGCFIFLRDDPLHIYVSSVGSLKETEAVAAARKLMQRSKR